MSDLNEIAAYDYELPPDRIAATPAARRDSARMQVVNRSSGEFEHRSIGDLPRYLCPNDVLVFNDTRVIRARLYGTRAATGGKWEGLFLRSRDAGVAEILSQTRGKLNPGEWIEVTPPHKRPDEQDGSALKLELLERAEDGKWIVAFVVNGERISDSDEVFGVLDRFGSVPLPPYIRDGHASAEDTERYQTVYARQPGSVAAPTAGLHFTPELLSRCQQAGATLQYVTLHVGVGTFRPIACDNLNDHNMHSEWCVLSKETAESINACRSRGGRVFAVGTTSVRTLESASASGELSSFAGETDLFIRPGHQFHAVDALLTNFHLPKSSLLVLVSTLAGHERIMRAYEEAIREGYRFYSYGDAMLII
ncbi:tRNA preQ1(34) S-adenosylmethionine ribosyltransferase-isomerase QueA [Stratiformator vulcanicus]|uniref:S-adenosylmethionine:tRNA ribosyltransferase-isomerase n=1 Tax=Stratiformator vulcanicus TaxID=2527980 RepID=A0A517R2B9_9PLAN|nr:tRNA preQ1(34) S-adenosylmethionine ribosyltransferase-isomerase QueA [Stratiformator vulcanicus]QDT38022.1 S-adenosylmethionine:tRNA ribosyltransferase-isomerase [Stratiformator vulcanicus]